MWTAKTLIRLGGCPGWSESSLGAHAILLVLSRCGSNKHYLHWWTVYYSSWRKTAPHILYPGQRTDWLEYHPNSLAEHASLHPFENKKSMKRHRLVQTGIQNIHESRRRQGNNTIELCLFWTMREPLENDGNMNVSKPLSSLFCQTIPLYYLWSIRHAI